MRERFPRSQNINMQIEANRDLILYDVGRQHVDDKFPNKLYNATGVLDVVLANCKFYVLVYTTAAFQAAGSSSQ